MPRAIDAYRAIDNIDEWLDSTGTVMLDRGSSSYGELIGCIEDTPTLTQPNEPLTLEELDGWNTKPAYLVPLGEQPWDAQWSIMRYGRFVVETNAGPTISICLSRHEYGKTWIAYRRPPEGGENI